jgi:hypothetical protein
MKKWLNQNPGLAVAYGFVVLIVLWAWSWTPYPYPPQYWVKRVFVTPRFVCNDGTVTWAKEPGSFCSKHGGVLRRYE